jgi:hypothetical protein
MPMNEEDTPGVHEEETPGVLANGDDDEDQDDEPHNPETQTPSVQRVRGLRPRKSRDFIHRHAYVMHLAMTQYSLKNGLKRLNKSG